MSDIRRIDFPGFTILGPSQRSYPSFKPEDWPKWTASIEGPSVVLEGEGRRIEVPRAKCVVYSESLGPGGTAASAPLKAPVAGGFDSPTGASKGKKL
jgi:hypothetical protein